MFRWVLISFRKQMFLMCIRRYSDHLPQHFGITPKEFGANYLDGTRRHYPEDTLTGPEDDASNFVDGTFVDSEKVLKGKDMFDHKILRATTGVLSTCFTLL